MFRGGEQVGTRRHFDERLTVFLLSRRNAFGAQRLGRYGAAAEFWSERWDAMLARVAEGPVSWRGPRGRPAIREADHAKAIEDRHALDAAERVRAYGRQGR